MNPLFKYAGAALFIIVAALLVSLVAINSASAADEKIQRAEYKIIDGDCEPRQSRVNRIVVEVKTPGILVLKWDNDLACGLTV